MFAISISVLALLVALISAFLAYIRYSTFFTPWFFFLVIEVILLHIISFIGLNWIGAAISQREHDLLFLCFAFYVFGFSLSYYFNFEALNRFAYFSVRLIPEIKITNIALLATTALYLLSMSILMYAGTAGLLWITDPRQAYLSYRGATGDGAFYTLAQWSFMIAASMWLFWAKQSLQRFLVVLSILLAVSYFFGSKQILLNILIFGFFILERSGFRITTRRILALTPFVITLFIYLLTSGQNDDSRFILASYFAEYTGNTLRIFSSGLENLFSPGEFIASSVWEYLPRILYPEKPYEYGQVLINAVLFPGAAEQGATPGLLFWSPYYLESGLVGVFFFGVAKGLFMSAFFKALRRVRQQPLQIIFAFGVSVTPLFLFAPLLYQYIFVFFISIILNLFNPRKNIK